MIIGTQRSDVLLKKFVPSDASRIFNLIDGSRSHLSRNGDETADKYKSLEDVTKSITNPPNPEKLRMGIWDGSDLVGSINLTPLEEGIFEVGYYLGADYTGRGYATLAVTALTDYAFRQECKRIIAKVHKDNEKSSAVLLRSGYRKVDKSDETDLVYEKIS